MRGKRFGRPVAGLGLALAAVATAQPPAAAGDRDTRITEAQRAAGLTFEQVQRQAAGAAPPTVPAADAAAVAGLNGDIQRQIDAVKRRNADAQAAFDRQMADYQVQRAASERDRAAAAAAMADYRQAKAEADALALAYRQRYGSKPARPVPAAAPPPPPVAAPEAVRQVAAARPRRRCVVQTGSHIPLC